MMDTTTTTPEGNWNSTMTLEPIVPYVFASWSQAALYGSLTIIIGIFGIFGNLMVFMAVSLSKSLQDTTHVFVVSLAISDFLTALTLPFQGIAVLSEAGTGWPFGDVMCTLVGAMLLLTVPTSIVTMAAIAVNRYIIITKSMQLQQKIYTRRGVAIMVTLLWLFPFVVVVLPQLIPATGGIKYNPICMSCLWDLEHPLVLVFQSIASLFFISCTIVIIFCYIAIYVYVWKHVRATRNSLRASTDNINDLETSPVRLNKKQIDITKNLAIVVVVFFICVLPFSSNLYVQYYSLRLSYYALLVTLSSCLNPMIYAVRHPSFKAVFKCIFFCRFQDIPQPSEWLKTVLVRRNMTV